MKKKIISIIGIVTIALGITAVSASAKELYPKSVNEEVEMGRSIEDACGAVSIMALGGENMPILIYQKHDELGSWEKTAEYYGVNLDSFKTNIRRYKKEIPDDVYNEMKKSGMTDDECYDFARRSGNAQMDITVTWEAKKKGKTINDLIKEETARKNAELQTAADYTFGKITATQYTEKMKELSPDMDISDILSFAREEKRGWMEFRKATSGITDEELKAASDAGITDFFAACRLKDTVAISNSTFADMIYQVKMGKDVDSVINENVSTDKINDKVSKSHTDIE